jgi:hypothetical protein
MFTFRDTLETLGYCAATVCVGSAVLFGGSILDAASSEMVSGTPVVSSSYLGVDGNFNETAIVEAGRVTDLRDCDYDTTTESYYEIGVCLDHETRITNTPRVYPYPQGR